ncbi:MAG: cytochrome c maturation protein CcmE [Chloroflexi bacterium]|nr:cytochrome c maturation protein CcmE [Chloroflexota bacterium]
MTEEQKAKVRAGGRVKFVIGFLLMAAAVVYLIVSSTQAAAQYYLTIDELAAKGDSIRGRDLKISGAVDGDTITYDPETLTLRLRDEAQAILTGRMGDDGVFQASELLLKCPTRYEEEIPLQSAGG